MFPCPDDEINWIRYITEPRFSMLIQHYQVYDLMVQGVNVLPETFVKEQLRSVLSDMHPDVVCSSKLDLLLVCVWVGGWGSNINFIVMMYLFEMTG